MNKIKNALMGSVLVKALVNFRMFIVLLLGFTGGLPLALTGGTLTLWLSQKGASVESIGLFALVTTPYSLKFLWSPLLDRYFLSKFGRRRTWLLAAQIGLASSLAIMASADPTQSITFIAVMAVLVAFMSATQDIAIDAYRVESLKDEEQGLGSAVYVLGYRFGMMLSSFGALYIAGFFSWETTYLVMAAAVGIGIFATLITQEPNTKIAPPKTLRESVIEPLKNILTRRDIIWILLFIVLYKVGDIMASQVTNKLYTSKEYTSIELANIVKFVGIWAVIGGSFIGGLIMVKVRLKTALWLFGILQAVSTLGFVVLANSEKNLSILTGVIAFENVTGGMGTAAFIAFMAKHANRRFTATQFALMTSLMALPRNFLAAPTGFMVSAMGWAEFFTVCALLAIPGLMIIFFKFRDFESQDSQSNMPEVTPSAPNAATAG